MASTSCAARGEPAIVDFSRMTKVPLTLYITTDPIIRCKVRPRYTNGNIVSMRFVTLSINAPTKVLRNDATHNACLASEPRILHPETQQSTQCFNIGTLLCIATPDGAVEQDVASPRLFAIDDDRWLTSPYLVDQRPNVAEYMSHSGMVLWSICRLRMRVKDPFDEPSSMFND